MFDKSPEIVLVEWVDAYHLEGWQFGQSHTPQDLSCWTVGFCVAKHKEGYVIAQTWCSTDTANLIFIPRGMVKKFSVLGDLKTV